MQLEKRQQLTIAAVLAMLVAVTQGHHFATLVNLPPSAWAVFFLAGFYVRRTWVFTVLLAEIVAIDYFAITVGGVSSFCVSPAYVFLLPAYGTLWLAGRWFASRYSLSLSALPALGASLLGSVTLAELFTGGGFYFFSGRFTETSLAEFGSRLVTYFPHTLQSFAFWIAIAIVIHVAFALTNANKQHHA
jgi:hypothetical protein